jgi:hypothetical protein
VLLVWLFYHLDFTRISIKRDDELITRVIPGEVILQTQLATCQAALADKEQAESELTGCRADRNQLESELAGCRAALQQPDRDKPAETQPNEQSQ